MMHESSIYKSEDISCFGEKRGERERKHVKHEAEKEVKRRDCAREEEPQ